MSPLKASRLSAGGRLTVLDSNAKALVPGSTKIDMNFMKVNQIPVLKPNCVISIPSCVLCATNH